MTEAAARPPVPTNESLFTAINPNLYDKRKDDFNVKEWITYLGELILITAVSGLLSHIVPEGNMKKHLQFVISLCVLVALAVPMFSMVMELPEIFERGFEEVKAEEKYRALSAVEAKRRPACEVVRFPWLCDGIAIVDRVGKMVEMYE